MRVISVRRLHWNVFQSLCLILSNAVGAAGGTFYATTISFAEFVNYDGSTEFALTTFMSTALPTGRSEVLTAPNGVTFEAPFGHIRGLATWNDVASLMFGEWKFVSTSATESSDVEEYRFSVSHFDYQSLTTPFPQITPANLSAVPSQFTISWTPATHGSLGLGLWDGLAGLDYSIHPGSMDVSIETLSPGGYLLFDVGTEAQYLPQFISKPTGPAFDRLYDMATFLQYGRSMQAKYYPVPEPSGVAMLASVMTAGLCTAFQRRFLRAHLPAAAESTSTDAGSSLARAVESESGAFSARSSVG
jgi:hypothetical protein